MSIIGAMKPAVALVALVAAATTTSGCAVVGVAGAAVGAVISVGASVVSSGVEVTGKAIGAGIDAMSGPPEDAAAAKK